MSSTDRGSQDVTFDFKHPLQGKEFNKLLRGAIKHGIYQGGAVSITSDGSVAPGSNNAITIQPFQTVMNSGTDKLVNIATSASLQLTCNDTSGPQSASDTLLVMRYVWDDVIQNYIDFEYEDESTYVVLDTDVVVCKITYSAYPTISALDTTVRTSGIFDDDYNLVVENTAKTDTISERTLNTGINMGGSALFVDQANTRVGINDITPSYTLDVNGTLRTVGAVTLDSTLGVTGITTLTGLLNANGGIAVDTSNFTVDGTTGAVYTASTLGVNGVLTASSTSTLTGLVTVNTGIVPDANDGAYLGTTALSFSDLFLASGGVINFANSNMLVTHATGSLAITGGNVGIGVTPEAWNGSYTALQIGGTGALWSRSTEVASSVMYLANNMYYDGSFKPMVTDEVASMIMQDGIVVFYTDTVQTADEGFSPTERMRIDTSGNVGIGVTPSGWNSTYSALQLGGNGTWMANKTAGKSTGLYMSQNANFDTDSSWEYISGDGGAGSEACQYQLFQGTHAFSHAVAGTAGNDITWVTDLTIDASGKIATGGESTPLCAAGGMHIKVADAGNSSIIYTDLVVENSTNHGICILSPNTAQGVLSFETGLGGNNYGSIVFQHSATAASNVMGFRVWGSSTTRLGIYGDGSIKMPDVYGDTVTASVRTMYIDSGGFLGGISSTERSKTNIKPLNSYDFIYKLNPVNFNYRKKQTVEDKTIYLEEHEENLWYGLIAEEVEKIESELCLYDKKHNLISVRYEQFTGILIKVIQDHKKEIDKLNKAIRYLKSKVK